VGQQNKIVPKADMPGLAVQSRKPDAREFKARVTGTMLPAPNKELSYIMGAVTVATEQIVQFANSSTALVAL
jgi:prophage antirepressor-like protein